MKKFTSLLAVFIVCFAALTATAQTTYYYVGGNNATVDFSTGSTAWSTVGLGGAPANTVVPNASAIFIIDGSDVSNSGGLQTGTNVTISLANSRTIGQLIIRNDIDVALAGTGDLTIGSNNTGFIAGAEIDVDANSSLSITNTGNVLVQNNAGAAVADRHNVSIAGALIVDASRSLTVNAAHAAGSTPNLWGGVISCFGSVLIASGTTATYNTISGIVNIPAGGQFRIQGTGTGTRTTLSGTVTVTSTTFNAFQSAPSDSSCLTITGLLHYNGAGAQSTPSSFSVRNTGELRFDGSGAKSTVISNYIYGKVSMQGTATGNGAAPSYYGQGILEYKGTSAQTVSVAEWSSSTNQRPINVVILNPFGVTIPNSFQRDIPGYVQVGDGTINGLLTIGTQSQLTVGGNVTVNTGSTLNTASVVSTAGNLVNNGSLTYAANSGEFTFTGTGKTISGSATTQFRKFTVTAPASITLQRDIDITGNLVSFINGTLDASTYLIKEVVATTASVSISGRLRTANLLGVRGVVGATIDPALTITMQAGNVIEFYAPAGTQDVWAGDGTAYYQNVEITGNGIKRLVNNAATFIDIRENLSIATGSTLDALKNIEVSGNFTNNGTFNANTSIVELDGSSTQVLTMGTSSLYTLALANATANAMSLGSDATVTNQLTFTNGRLLLGNYNFTFGLNATVSGTASNLKMLVTDGTGECRKVVPAGGQTFTYPVGDITGTAEYSPVTLNFTANSAQRTIGTRVVDAQHPNDGSATSFISRYWAFSATPSTGTYTYNATYTFVAADLVAPFAPMLASYIYPPATTWNGVTSTPSATNIVANGVTQATGALNGANVTGRISSINGCPPLAQPDNFTASTATVCAGQTGVVYTVPNVSSLTYTWAYTGIGATINGNGSSITVDFALNATAGTLSVTASNTCGEVSLPRTIAITINPATGTPTFTNGATTLCAGGTSTYQASAANATSITYSIVGNTGATINATTGVVSNVTGNFTVRATAVGLCGTTTADRVVTISGATGTPSFTNGATTLCAGQTSTYQASAANATSITYSIVGNIGATINATTGVVSNATGNFTVRATAVGLCGTTTADRVVTVNPGAVITTQPQAQTVCAGASATFTVGMSNTNGVSYQWYVNGNPSQTTASLNLTNVQTPGATVYVEVTTTCGVITSNIVNLTVLNALNINQQPQSVTACFGDAVTFSVATNDNNAQYQWQLNGGDINGANSASYTVSSANLTNDGDYTVNITGTCGNATSNIAVLNVLPVLVTFSTATICNGDSYNFNGTLVSTQGTYTDTLQALSNGCDSILMLDLTVNNPDAVVSQTNNVNLATGSFSSYQWHVNNQPINNATTQTWVAVVEGDYYVVVTDANGCVDTSNTVTVLTIGVKEQTQVFTIYPNPTNGNVFINGTNLGVDKLSYTLVDVTGRVLHSAVLNTANAAVNAQVDLGAYAPGVYLLQINLNDTIHCYRVIKQD